MEEIDIRGDFFACINLEKDFEKYENIMEKLEDCNKIAWMGGYSGFPSAKYERWLYECNNELYLVSEDEDWIDYWDEEEDGIRYDKKEFFTIERISPSEAKKLRWDKVFGEF